jgi:DNA-binding GntR family transcriptional regulator
MTSADATRQKGRQVAGSLTLELKEPLAGFHAERATLGEHAYREIREAILEVKLPPGIVISEQELATAIGISRTPVREAIRRLVEENLLEVSGQSTRVCRIDVGRARQSIFLRATIESSVVATVKSFPRRAVAELEKDIASYRKVIKSGTIAEAHREDDKFHRHLMKLCGYPLANTVAFMLSNDISRIMCLMGENKEYYDGVLRDHIDITARLAAGDIDGAAKLLQFHLDGFRLDQDELLRRARDMFVVDSSR